MKTIIFLGILGITAILFTSCEKELNKVVLTDHNIPTQITAYQAQHFADNTIIKVVKDKELLSFTYNVYLAGNIKLEFNSKYEITEIDGTTKLPNSVIPKSILKYIVKYYPNNFITDWNLKRNYQEIELNNGLKLDFRLDGTFLRVDID